MITVYACALLLVTTFATANAIGRTGSGILVGYILLLPVFLRALGWI